MRVDRTPCPVTGEMASSVCMTDSALSARWWHDSVHLCVISFSIVKDVIYLLSGHAACEILVIQPGIEPLPPALGVWSLNH